MWWMALTFAGDPAQPAPEAAMAPSWLAGCWTSTGKRPYREAWLGPDHGVFVGAALMHGDDAASWEHLWLGRKDGVWTYIADPSEQERTAFAATKTGPDHWVFENPKHDFPQRISYVHHERGLTVRVEARSTEAESGWRGFALELERCSD